MHKMVSWFTCMIPTITSNLLYIISSKYKPKTSSSDVETLTANPAYESVFLDQDATGRQTDQVDEYYSHIQFDY